jgi:hypothetical protein
VTKDARTQTAVHAHYVLIGPSHDPQEIANAFAALDLVAPNLASNGDTRKIPTTNIKIWTHPNGARTIEVTSPSGRAEVRLGPPPPTQKT